MVCILVGAEEKEFLAHKDFLCHYSEYFDKALNGPFIEGQSMVVTLKEDNPEAFAVFLDWIYTQKLDANPLIVGSKEPMGYHEAMALFVRVWCLADYLQVPGLQNLAMDAVIQWERHCYIVPTGILHLVYSLSPPNAPLRQYFVDAITREMPDEGFHKHAKEFPHDMLLDMLTTFSKGTRWVDNETPMDTPRNYYVPIGEE